MSFLQVSVSPILATVGLIWPQCIFLVKCYKKMTAAHDCTLVTKWLPWPCSQVSSPKQFMFCIVGWGRKKIFGKLMSKQVEETGSN